MANSWYNQKVISKEHSIVQNKSVNSNDITITIIYDNNEYDSMLNTAFGFSCLIQTPDKNILFDTGADSPTLLSNMHKLGIDPKDIEIVVLSHIHWDHTGGLFGFLEKNSDVMVYIPASFPDEFKKDIQSAGAQFVEVSSPLKISDYASTTGELEGPPEEQSLVISTSNGIVVITGCAHPGIVNIVKKAKEIINKDIYLVLGGFHLARADDSTINNIIESFKKLNVEKVAPCHCSGTRTREYFKKEYKENYIESGVGKIIKL